MAREIIFEGEVVDTVEDEKCNKCGKVVHNPVYAPKHEETARTAPYHKQCLDKLAREWERNNP